MGTEHLKIFAFICTRSDKLTPITEKLLQYLYSCGIKVNLLINKPSIFSAYSDGLNLIKEEVSEDDIIIFCHDDIEILNNKDDFLNVLIQSTDKKMSGFVGPAGTTYLGLDAVWWNHQLWSQGMHKGLVFHGGQGITDVESLETTFYGNYGQVVVLDGLFLACRYRILRDIKITKPGAFEGDWDFYDIWYTSQSYLKGYKNKAVPVLIKHSSFGNLAGRDSWHKNREAFISITKLPLKI